MCTKTPAKLLGRDDIGDIAIGMKADINILDSKGEVCAIVMDGKTVDREALKI